jgi:hypothetical protein
MRRYPDAHVFVVPGVWENDAVVPDASRPTEPVLQGAVDTRSVFFGFPVAVPAMRGDRASSERTEATAGWSWPSRSARTARASGWTRARRART